MYYIHKHEIALRYGGPEEGGWWYTMGVPDEDWAPAGYNEEKEAYRYCAMLNQDERERQERDEEYGFTSVLAYRSTHYEFRVEEFKTPRIFPERKPHYE